MSDHISLRDYFGPHWDHDDVTDEVLANATELVHRANAVLEQMVAGGCTPLRNPGTNTYISGQTLGGFRPQSSAVGAPRSKHKMGQALDLYDPYRELAKWAVNHPADMKDIGLWIEDPRWTPTWLHIQSVPPGNPPNPAKLVFIPDNSPPKVAALPGQRVLA